MEHHRICSRVHRIHDPRLAGALGYGRVGRRIGSIRYIVAHVDVGWIGPVCLRQHVEEQTGQVLEGDPGPTTIKHVAHLPDNIPLGSVNSLQDESEAFDMGLVTAFLDFQLAPA